MMSTYFINLDSVNNYQRSLSTEEILQGFKDGLQSIHWNAIDNKKFSCYEYLEIDVSDHFSSSDYSGSHIEKVNVRSFLEDLPDEDSRYVVEIYGGHGSESLGFIKYSDTDTYENSEYIRECLAALADYPSLNDDNLSEYEWSQYIEYWDSEGKKDFISYLKDNLPELKMNDYLIEHIEEIEDTEFFKWYTSQDLSWEYTFSGQDIQMNFRECDISYQDLLNWVVTINKAELQYTKYCRSLIYARCGVIGMYWFNKYRPMLCRFRDILLYGKQLKLDL